MKQGIQKRIDERFKDVKGISPEWFIRFFDMLDKCGVAQETISKALDFALSEENLNSTAKSSNRDGFNKDPRHTPAMLDEFFTYLTNISNEIGIDRFREFLEDTLSQMEIDFDDLSKQDHTKNTCFKNLFLKYLVKSHPKDVQLINSKTPIEELSPETDISTIDLKIGGMSIGDIHFEEVAGNPPMITFTDLRTLPGLERMGLGSYVFREFCKQVNEHKHGYSVLAWNVVKDKDGSKVYPKWGAYPVKAYVENDFWEIDTTPLTDKEMDEWYGAHGRAYYFSPEKIEEISKQPNNRYGKQEKVEELAL